DDPLEPGRKCFRLNHAALSQGLVLPLKTAVPIQEFGGLSFEAYIPAGAPKGCVLVGVLADEKEKNAETLPQPAKTGAWQKFVYGSKDYKNGFDQLSTLVTTVYVFERIANPSPSPLPRHELYLRHL